MTIKSTSSQDYPQHGFKGVPWLLLALISFVTSDFLIKMLLDFYSVIEATYLRAAGRLIPAIFLAFCLHKPKDILFKRNAKIHFLRCCITTISTFLFLSAYKFIPLSQSYALGYSAPLFLIILSKLMLHESLGKHKLLAVLIGLMGIIIAIKPTMDFQIGSLIVLLGALLASLNKILIKHLLKNCHNLTLIIYQNLFLLIITTPFLLEDWVTPSPQHMGYLLLVGTLALLGQYAMMQAIRLSPLSVLAPFDYNSFIFVLLFEYALWDSIPSTSLLIGVFFIILSNLYATYHGTKKGKENISYISECQEQDKRVILESNRRSTLMF